MTIAITVKRPTTTREATIVASLASDVDGGTIGTKAQQSTDGGVMS